MTFLRNFGMAIVFMLGAMAFLSVFFGVGFGTAWVYAQFFEGGYMATPTVGTGTTMIVTVLVEMAILMAALKTWAH